MSKNIVINGERVYPRGYVIIDSEEHGEITGRIYKEHKSSYDVLTDYGKIRFSKKDNSSYGFGCSDVVAVAINKYDTLSFFDRLSKSFGSIDFSGLQDSINNFKNCFKYVKYLTENK